MKKLVSFLWFLFVAITGVCSADLAWYTIDSYNADFTLEESWILKVEETITVNFTENRHGIYRDIPIRFKKDKSTAIRTPISNVNVKDYQFSTTESDWTYEIKIGSPNYEVLWKQVYVISYYVDWAIRTFSGRQELYRNMLWLDWAVPINNFNFAVHLPNTLQLRTGDYYVVFWTKGSTDKLDVTYEWNTIFNQEPQNLPPKQWVTIWIKFLEDTFPKREYTVFVSNKKDSVTHNYSDIFSFEGQGSGLLTIISLIFLLIFSTVDVSIKLPPVHHRKKWKTVRDVIHYTPPKNLTPAEIAFLYHRYPNFNMVPILLYSWINEGYLEVQQLWDSKEVEFVTTDKKPKFDDKTGKNKEWYCWKILILNGKVKKKLPSYQKEAMNEALSIWCNFTKKKIIPGYHGIYENKDTYDFRLLFIVLGTFILWMDSNAWAAYFAIYLTIVLIKYLYYSWRESRKTRDEEWFLTQEWREILEQINGFRKYLSAVEDEKLEQLTKDDPKYFEKILPFALALWIGDYWIKKSKAIASTANIGTELIPNTSGYNSLLSSSTYNISHATFGVWEGILAKVSSDDSWRWSSSWFSSSWSSSWSSWWGWWGWGWWSR